VNGAGHRLVHLNCNASPFRSTIPCPGYRANEGQQEQATHKFSLGVSHFYSSAPTIVFSGNKSGVE
jgi:hypothetical protein